MPRLPRTKDEILEEVRLNLFIPTNSIEQIMPLVLEVLLDIRDNLEIPVLLEEDIIK